MLFILFSNCSSFDRWASSVGSWFFSFDMTPSRWLIIIIIIIIKHFLSFWHHKKTQVLAYSCPEQATCPRSLGAFQQREYQNPGLGSGSAPCSRVVLPLAVSGQRKDKDVGLLTCPRSCRYLLCNLLYLCELQHELLLQL